MIPVVGKVIAAVLAEARFEKIEKVATKAAELVGKIIKPKIDK